MDSDWVFVSDSFWWEFWITAHSAVYILCSNDFTFKYQLIHRIVNDCTSARHIIPTYRPLNSVMFILFMGMRTWSTAPKDARLATPTALWQIVSYKLCRQTPIPMNRAHNTHTQVTGTHIWNRSTNGIPYLTLNATIAISSHAKRIPFSIQTRFRLRSSTRVFSPYVPVAECLST